ncbi:hypothetical protein GAMM_100126 [Gammaproteobacteria bacterium]
MNPQQDQIVEIKLPGQEVPKKGDVLVPITVPPKDDQKDISITVPAKQEVGDQKDVSITLPATPPKNPKPSTDILTRDRAYGIFSLDFDASKRANNDKELIDQMAATIKEPGPDCDKVKATDLSGLSEGEEPSLRKLLDRIVEGSGNRLFLAIPGIDYTDKAVAKKKIEDSIGKSIPTFEECLKATGIEIKKDVAVKAKIDADAARKEFDQLSQGDPKRVETLANVTQLEKVAGEAEKRQQQLKDFGKKYTDMREATIELDVKLYLTGATYGTVIEEDVDAAKKTAIAADEKEYKERIKKLDTDEELTTLSGLGPVDDAFMKQLTHFNAKTAGYSSLEELLKGTAKEVGKGLYVKLDSKGGKFFIITNPNAENTRKVIEAKKNQEKIEWTNVSTDGGRQKEIQRLCLAAGKRVFINGNETQLSKVMPPRDPENYTQWIKNIRAIRDKDPKNPIAYDQCLKDLGDVLDEKGPEAKRQFWSHLSQYGSVEDRAAAEVVMKGRHTHIFGKAPLQVRAKDVGILKTGVVKRLKNIKAQRKKRKAEKAEKADESTATKAEIKQLNVRFNNEIEDFMKLAEGDLEGAAELGTDAGKEIVDVVSSKYLKRFDKIAKKLKTIEETQGKELEKEKTQRDLTLAKVTKLSETAKPTPAQVQLDNYLVKRALLKTVKPNEIEKLKQELAVLAEALPETGDERKAVVALEKQDKAVQDVVGKVKQEEGKRDVVLKDAETLPLLKAYLVKRKDLEDAKNVAKPDESKIEGLKKELDLAKEALPKDSEVGKKALEAVNALEERDKAVQIVVDEMDKAKKEMDSVLEIATKLSTTPVLKDYVEKRAKLDAAKKDNKSTEEIAKLEGEVIALADKIALEGTPEEKNSVDLLGKQDKTFQAVEEKIKLGKELREEFISAQKGCLALAGSDLVLLKRFVSNLIKKHPEELKNIDSYVTGDDKSRASQIEALQTICIKELDELLEVEPKQKTGQKPEELAQFKAQKDAIAQALLSPTASKKLWVDIKANHPKMVGLLVQHLNQDQRIALLKEETKLLRASQKKEDKVEQEKVKGNMLAIIAVVTDPKQLQQLWVELSKDLKPEECGELFNKEKKGILQKHYTNESQRLVMELKEAKASNKDLAKLDAELAEVRKEQLQFVGEDPEQLDKLLDERLDEKLSAVDTKAQEVTEATSKVEVQLDAIDKASLSGMYYEKRKELNSEIVALQNADQNIDNDRVNKLRGEVAELEKDVKLHVKSGGKEEEGTLVELLKIEDKKIQEVGQEIGVLTDGFSDKQNKSLKERYIAELNDVPKLEAEGLKNTPKLTLEVEAAKNTLNGKIDEAKKVLDPKSYELKDYLDKRDKLTVAQETLEKLKSELQGVQRSLKKAINDKPPKPAIIEALKQKKSELEKKIAVANKEVGGLKDKVTEAAKVVKKAVDKKTEGDAVDAVENADTKLQQQREELTKAQGMLAATERRFGLFVISAAKGVPGKIIGLVNGITNPMTRIEVLNGLPEPYKTSVKKGPAYKKIEELIKQKKDEPRVDQKPKPKPKPPSVG